MRKRANQAEPIWDGEKWIYRPYVEGVQKKYTSRKPGKLGAIECRKKYTAAVDRSDRRDLRLSKAWELFLDDLADELGKDSETYRKNESIGRVHILPRLKNKKVALITDQDWQECISKAKKTRGGTEQLSKKSYKHIRAAITRFTKYARKQRLIDYPAVGLYVPRSAPTYQRQIIQPDVLRLFLSDPGDDWWYWNAWRLMVVTGLRPGECYGLEKEDVEGPVIRIGRSIRKDGTITEGKNDNARRVMVKTNIARTIIDAQLARLHESKLYFSRWLFCDPDGLQPRPNVIWHDWEDYRTELPYHVTLYSLRHTFISLTEKYLTKSMIKALVGHSETMPIDTYLHKIDGDDQAAAQIVDKVFQEIIG